LDQFIQLRLQKILGIKRLWQRRAHLVEKGGDSHPRQEVGGLHAMEAEGLRGLQEQWAACLRTRRTQKNVDRSRLIYICSSLRRTSAMRPPSSVCML